MPIQNTSFLYRPVLRKAWEITKRFKSLWLFGLFAVLVSSGGEYEIIMRAFYNPQNQGFWMSLWEGAKAGWEEGIVFSGGNFFAGLWQSLITDSGTFMMGLFVLLSMIVLVLLITWLAVSSQIALIKGSSLGAKGKKIQNDEALKFANVNFWPVLVIMIGLKIALFVLFAIFGWVLWLVAGLGITGQIISVLCFAIFIVLALIISFVVKYQTLFISLKKQKIIPALKSAWQLFLGNWLISLEMAFMMLGAYIVATVIWVFLVALLAGIPIVIIPLYLTSLPIALKIAVSALAGALAIVVIPVTTSVVTVFQWAGWTVLFERLIGEGEDLSKIERVVQGVKDLPKNIPQYFNK
jgi:hypothetical protein